MTVDWKGVYPALMTEFKQDGSLDLPATGRHVDSCIAAGVDGFVMLGTLGENLSLTAEEQSAVRATAVEAAAGRVPVLSGIADYTTDFAIARVAQAAKDGCDGVMVLPPMVYKTDAAETLAHFEAVAEASSLPIMIYNNPVTYGVDMSPAGFATLARQESVVAIKESSDDVRRITDLKNEVGDRFILFCGVDDLALESLLLGAQGWVAGLVNAFPKETVALHRLIQARKLDEALALYRWFMPLLHLDCHVKLVQYIKLANAMTGEGSEWTRRPRLPLAGEERSRIEAVIAKALETRPAV
ncbi:MAG: dihydrodipicolinate synthase family protein [Rhodospirillales bacterium]